MLRSLQLAVWLLRLRENVSRACLTLQLSVTCSKASAIYRRSRSVHSCSKPIPAAVCLLGVSEVKGKRSPLKMDAALLT